MTKKTVRFRIWNKVMVKSVNEGLRQGIFTLNPAKDPESIAGYGSESRGVLYRFLIGKHESVTHVRGISHGELRIKTIVNPKQVRNYEWEGASLSGPDAFKFCDLFVSGWLEREAGTWIQYSGHSVISCRTWLKKELLSVTDEEPIGFDLTGKFFL